MNRSRPSRTSPRQAASQVVSRLEALADPEVAVRARTFFKRGDAVTLYGVKAPELHALARRIYDRVKPPWDVADATAFCEILSKRRFFEAKMVGVLVLGRFARQFPSTLFSRARGWIEAGRFCNWAAIDGLCPNVTTPLIRKYPGLIPRVTRWAGARNLWLQRASVVTLVPLARKGEHLDEAYSVVVSLFDSSEDLLHKACGWLLREAGKADMPRLERFLLAHGSAVPRTTVRYAIERFPETRRRQLLKRTRN